MKIHARAEIKFLSRSKPKLFYPLKTIHNPSLSAPFPTTISLLTHSLTRLSPLLQLSLNTHSHSPTLFLHSHSLSPQPSLSHSLTPSLPIHSPLSLQTLLTLSPYHLPHLSPFTHPLSLHSLTQPPLSPHSLTSLLLSPTHPPFSLLNLPPLSHSLIT